MKKIILFAYLLIVLFTSCKTSQTANLKSAENKIEISILHVNDVYEISPLEGGKVGGMARLATLKKELTRKNPNTLTILAGDFLNPALISTFKPNGIHGFNHLFSLYAFAFVFESTDECRIQKITR